MTPSNWSATFGWHIAWRDNNHFLVSSLSCIAIFSLNFLSQVWELTLPLSTVSFQIIISEWGGNKYGSVPPLKNLCGGWGI